MSGSRATCSLLLACWVLSAPAAAQDAAPRRDGGRIYPPRIYTTQRLTTKPPRIDGRLDDEAWREGEWSGNYTQQLPTEGAPPSVPTELKILYDDENVYVAIRAYDDPARVNRYPARRDGFAGDIVGVCFDSYFDKRTGFEFDLTAGGGKLDLILTNEGWDTNWDAVWHGKVGQEPDAWTAEFQIPLSQLRYGTHEEQVWGLHAWRWIDRHQEEDQWNLIPRNSTGRMFNLGELHGIRGLPRSRRLEVLPHTVVDVEAEPDGPGSADRNGTDGGGSVGLDVKLGLTSDFTLDATVNPDFGQVEADPSVVNLTTYETFFEEKRPFFLEGRAILDMTLEGSAIAGDRSLRGDTLFYSRRIGEAPHGEPEADDDAVEVPGHTSILSAVKVTGKTRNGLSVAVLQSVTAEETARIVENGIEQHEVVEPTTNHLAGRVQKDWSKGNTILGGMLTSTYRWIDSPALASLPTDAVTGGVDFVQFLAGRSYVLEARGVFSRVAGSATAIEALQKDAVHYFQRPDADHLSLDPGATSLTGHGGAVRFARYGNSKWRASEQVRWVSPGLDVNDLGYLRQADLIENTASLGFEQTDPRGPFRTFSTSVARDDVWDFGGIKTSAITSVQGTTVFRNKWRLAGTVHVVEPPVYTRLLRGGPAFEGTSWLGVSINGATDDSKRLAAGLGWSRHMASEGDSSDRLMTAGVRVRPVRTLSISAEVGYERHTDDIQYVETADTAGQPRYVLGRIAQRTLSTTLRADLLLTPEFSVQYYGSPFVSSGRYTGFKRVTSPRAPAYADRFRLFSPDEIRYVPETNSYLVHEGEPRAAYSFANPDFSVREFRSNLVARWEFRPGSTLYLVWSQDRAGETDYWDPSLGDSLSALRRTPATNVLLAKISYWFSL